jgi:protein tyrosine phosphatase
MDRVATWLWVGDAQSGRDWRAVEVAGINAVCNVTPQTDDWPPEVKARIPYLRLNQDDGVAIPYEKLDAFAAWVFLIYKPGTTVLLVHCGAGVSRASTFAALAMMLLYKADWQTALTPIRAARPTINPNPVLVASVVEWWLYRGGRPEALVGAR